MAQQTLSSLIHVLGQRLTGDLGPLTIYTATNGALVFYPKAPPLSAPTSAQIHARNRFRFAGSAWSNLTPKDRSNWNEATKRASLRINGYNLFVHWTLVRNPLTIRTVERISGITLLPD